MQTAREVIGSAVSEVILQPLPVREQWRKAGWVAWCGKEMSSILRGAEAVDKEGSTAFFVEFGIKQFRRKVFYMFRTNPSREFHPETVNIEDLVPQDHLLRKI